MGWEENMTQGKGGDRRDDRQETQVIKETVGTEREGGVKRAWEKGGRKKMVIEGENRMANKKKYIYMWKGVYLR